MAESARHMRALLTLSLRAPEPQRVAAEQELQQLQQSPVSAPFLAAVLELSVAVPGADGEPTNVALLREVDDDTRLLACLWLKHYLKRQWKSKDNTLGDAERQHARRVLLFAALREPNDTIALHLALIIAQIARAEFPAQWPFDELFPPMLQVLQRSVAAGGDGDVREEKRNLDVVHRLIKELATRRLMVHRKQFAVLAVDVLTLLLQFWKTSASKTMELMWQQFQVLSQAAAPDAAAQAQSYLTVSGAERLAVVLRTVKVLSTLMLNAFRDLAALQNGELIRSTLVEFYNQLENMAKFRNALCNDAGALANLEPVVVLVDKCMHRIAAIVVEIQKSYPIEFREYLPPFLTLFWEILQSSAPRTMAPMSTTALPLPERLQIAALQFFANVLGCRLYKNESLSTSSSRIITKVITASGSVELTDKMVLEAQSAVQGFFSVESENRFETLLELVVIRYMRLSAKDFEDWQNDPEGFCNISESLTAQESVRACAENLFLTLLQNFPQEVIPGLTTMTAIVSSYLQELSARGQSAAADDEQRIVDTDAVLLAIGLGCYDLHECFEFEPWFLSNVVPILANPDLSIGCIRGLPVLRFRIVWLVSCWLAQLSAELRPPLYDVLLSEAVFVPAADAALKLRVVQTLESMVNDWGFEVDPFAPFMSRALQCLFAFFPQAEESDSKMKILSCLEAIVQAFGVGIISFANVISSPLPAMWAEESEASNLVRGMILQLLAKLLSTINEDQSIARSNESAADVQALVGMCLQVIRFATDISNTDEVFLMENGLDLWLNSLNISPWYNEELHAVFGNALRLMERDYEHVKVVLSILERYVQLGDGRFWEVYHDPVMAMLGNVIGNVRAEASQQLAGVTEVIICRHPIELLGNCFPLVKTMIAACLSFHRKDPQCEPDGVIASYLSVIALLMMKSYETCLVHVFENDQTVLLAVVEVMLKVFFTVGSSPLTTARRKVWAVALCSALSLLNEQMLAKAGEVFEVCVDVMEAEQMDSEERARANESSSQDENGGGRGVFRAYRALQSQQPRCGTDVETAVRAVDVKVVAVTRVVEISSRLGKAGFEHFLESIDSSVLDKLKA